VAAIIGPADDGREAPGQAKGKDHFAGDGAEAHAVACDMAREQKARLEVVRSGLQLQRIKARTLIVLVAGNLRLRGLLYR